MSRVWSGTSRPRVAALILAAVASTALSCGLWRGAPPPEPVAVPPPSRSVPAAPVTGGPVAAPAPAAEGVTGSAAPVPGVGAEPPPAAAPGAPQGTVRESGEAAGTPPAPGAAALPAESRPPAEPPASQVGPSAEPAVPQLPEAATAAEAEAGNAKAGAASPAPGSRGAAVESAAKPRAEAAEAAGGTGAPKGHGESPARVVVARLPDHMAFDQSGPYWTRGREELVYRVEFLGITMGYARFAFQGKVLLGGREAYHLSVRAWTASVLALIYPINDTIDYYMDVKTLEPLRQEYTTGNRKKDDVMIYDQATGRIVYRYKESGEIRKQVEAVPNIYDPVTLAYFIRSRGPAVDEKGKNVYAGRKVWEISARSLGVEKIATERGEVDTIVVRPVIKRDGKVEDKGDLRMWMTRDERKIPVRVYAKFKKIRTWTLVGELLPDGKGG